MKSAWVALALASLAYAQTNSTSPIPQGLSQSCTTYLTGLNENAKLNDCLSNLISATSDFGSSGSTPTAESINNVLNTICASNWNHCDASALRSTLVSFYSNCQTDMLGPSGTGADGRKDVIEKYDYIYLLSPLKDAMCTRDTDNAFCLKKLNDGTASPFTGGTVSSASSPSSGSVLASSSSSSSSAASPSPSNAKRAHLNQDQMFKRASHHHNALVARQQSNTTQTTLTPNAEQYNTNGLPYLFLTPETEDSKICTQCTYNILLKYITFESITPYALGISNSPILSGQLALWDKVKTCPNNLAASIVTDATHQANTSGALEDATVYGGATMLAAIAAALFGAVTLF
ncbi:hypothetical protein CPB86DRAFT_788027 [Serendipita vermifera]|jgi:hypothetical protein|nr:hypothetical protein CPB86DRAFT_788027 [Serendipita vermifera]